MKQRKLGNLDLNVSEVGLGCMSFAGFYASTTKEESFKCLDEARNVGINFLDTAEMYGWGISENIIGEYQSKNKYHFNIATKGGIVKGAPRGTNDNSEAGLRNALEGSLTRLKVDYIPLYYIHRRDYKYDIENVTGTLTKFIEEGKIGGFGFSEISPSSLRRASKIHQVTAIQNEYSLWTRYPDLGMLQTCQELGTAFVPFSPLGRGILSDTNVIPSNFSETDFRKSQPRFLEPNFSKNMEIIKTFREFCALRGWTTAGTSIAWTLDQGNHTIPIPGTRSARNLRDFISGTEILFTDEDRAEINKILPAGWAHGDRYSDAQVTGVERYC